MKVFVTGITGSVGRNLVEALLERKYSVVGLIREDVKDRKPEILHYLEKENVELVYGDITDLKSITRALDSISGNTDIAIIHLAAVIESKDPHFFLEINVKGSENLYKAVLQSKKPIKHIIHFSTAAVHGPRHPNEKITENTSFLPETPYEKSKYQGEKIARKFMEDDNLPITILRPVHIYGPHFVDHLLIRMIKMVRSRFVITPPRIPLDLVYVKNLVNATILVLEKRKKSLRQTYIINDGKNYTTDDINVNLIKIFRNDPIVIHIPRFLASIYSKITKSFRYGLKNVSYSCDKIIKQIGYKPKFSLRKGFTEYLSWLVTFGVLDSQYIINNSEALRESLSGDKGIGCAYDFVVRLKNFMPLYREATQGKSNHSILLVTPDMKFCPPLEIRYLEDTIQNLQVRRVVIPYRNPTSIQIRESLKKLENIKFDLSLFIGEDMEFDALKSLTEKLRTFSDYVGIFVHNGDNTYHLGDWIGVKARDVVSLYPRKREYVDIPLIPANIHVKAFHDKSKSSIKNFFLLSLGLTILLISKLEYKFPEFIKKRLAHQLFLVW